MSHAHAYRSRYDAVIVGARCAGASTAMLLARAGAKVLLIDRQAYGSDAVSTHALMRGGVLQLARWGLRARVMSAGTPEIKRTTFHYGKETTRVDIRPDHGIGYLAATRRMLLDRVLVDAARVAGAEVRHGVSLADLQIGPDGRVSGVVLKEPGGEAVTVASDLVVGADGRRSPVARRVAVQTTVAGASASGYVYGYYADMAYDGYHWYFETDTAAGVIPTNDGAHCIFVGVPQERFAETFRKNLDGGFLRTAAANSPALRDDIAKARRVGRLRGFAGGAGYLRRCHGPGWALVGDAGYFKDPLTAHGITDALRNAELLARAALAGGAPAFASYQAERDSLSRPLLDVTDTIASFDWELEELKDHHARLSEAMKAEVDHIAEFSTLDALAA